MAPDPTKHDAAALAAEALDLATKLDRYPNPATVLIVRAADLLRVAHALSLVIEQLFRHRDWADVRTNGHTRG